MGHISPNRAGLSFAAVLAGWHVVWSLLVAFGAAQQVLDTAYTLHAMKNDAVVGPFNPMTAGLLVLATGLIGYASGFGAAVTWNCLHRWCACEAVSSRPAASPSQQAPRQAA